MASASVQHLKPKIIILKSSQPGREPLPFIPKSWNKITEPALGLISKTHSYFDYNEASSSLQKAIRRGNELESIQWAIEMAFTGPAALSNLWNKFLLISLEEIGLADPMAFINIHWLYQNSRQESSAIALAASYLSKCKKCRINDWAAHMYPEINCDQSNKIVADIKLDLPVGSTGPTGQTTSTVAVGPMIYEAYKKFYEAFKSKDLSNSIYWAIILFFNRTKIMAKYKSPQFLIWMAFDLCFNYTINIETIVANSILKYYEVMRSLALRTEFRFKARSIILIMHIIMMWCLGSWPDDITPTIKLSDQFDNAIVKFINHDRSTMVGIDTDVALDMYTARGRKMLRGLDHYMNVACLLQNKHTDWSNLAYEYKLIVCKKLKVQLTQCK